MDQVTQQDTQNTLSGNWARVTGAKMDILSRSAPVVAEQVSKLEVKGLKR